MQLSQCKSCNNHICVMGEKVLCGYKIDREELPVRMTTEGIQVVQGCPKEGK